MIIQICFCYTAAIISIASLAQSSLKAGQTFRDCKTCPEMVVVPAGSFMMGSPANEPGRFSFSEEEPYEGPQRLVSIHQFAAGKFDITKEQWAAFVKATNRITTGGCTWAALPGDTTKPWNPSPSASWQHLGFQQDSNHPVVCITWDDAQDYVRWLSKKTSFTYRLLSEAEWEYASRAGTTTPYSWGSVASHEYANYGRDTTAGFGFASGRDKWEYGTSPVGAFPPNQFGLYDMNGNVMQWVEDCFSASYSGLPTDGSAYKVDVKLKLREKPLLYMNGNSSCSYRICRGGCFGDPPRMIRAAFRNSGPSGDYRSSGVGFRVAKTLY